MGKCKCFEKPINQDLTLRERLNKGCCCCGKTAVEEHGKRFGLVNHKSFNIKRHKLDDHVIRDAVNKKCDYLYALTSDADESSQLSVFVELKGTDIEHAFKQMENTIRMFDKEKLLTGKAVKCCIVHGRVPKIDGIIRDCEADLLDKFSGKIHGFNVHTNNTNINYDPVQDKIIK